MPFIKWSEVHFYCHWNISSSTCCANKFKSSIIFRRPYSFNVPNVTQACTHPSGGIECFLIGIICSVDRFRWTMLRQAGVQWFVELSERYQRLGLFSLLLGWFDNQTVLEIEKVPLNVLKYSGIKGLVKVEHCKDVLCTLQLFWFRNANLYLNEDINNKSY